ncbi:MAG: zinc-ribbon domain-containing protein, partial [Polyangiaceae bacterium]
MGVPTRPEAKLKIACQSCQAKYTIADEKVVGKIVKIRCKKCGATIVINGNDPEATSPLPAGETGSEWTVNVAEGDQRTMTTDEIVEAYGQGVVTEDTFCWKDGMADWLPLREVDELASMVGGGGDETAVAHQPAGGADFAPLSGRGGFDDQATVPVQRENLAGLFSGGGGGSNGHAESNGNGASLFSGGAPSAPTSQPQAAPAAARRAGGRAGGADLFGGVATAGAEEDVMTSAPHGAPQAPIDDGKLTGQRNENSVLFSLSALTSNSPKVEKEKPTADGSGLIDIRALSSSMATDQGKKKEHVDDIMNLGGGGAFSAALTAPILAPPIASADFNDGGSAGQKNNTKMIAIIGGLLAFLLLVIIILVVKLSTGPKVDDTIATNPTGTTTGAGTATAAPTDSAAAAGTGTVAADSTAAGANTGSGGALPPGTGAVAANNPPSTPTHSTGGSTHSTHESTHESTTPPPSTGGGGGGGGLLGAMENTVPGQKPSSGGGASSSGGTAPFDRGAAAATLGSIASSLGSC